jgi:hypothetical protein
MPIAARGLPCEAFPDGMAVPAGDDTVCAPDALVRCGDPLPDDYFRVPSVMHYLLVKTERPTVIHHRRGDGNAIATRIVAGGTLSLDPPGLRLDIDRLYA